MLIIYYEDVEGESGKTLSLEEQQQKILLVLLKVDILKLKMLEI